MHFLVFLGPVVAMDTKGCQGWRLGHSLFLRSQLAPANVFTVFEQVRKWSRSLLLNPALHTLQTSEAPLWKARLVLRQPSSFSRSGVCGTPGSETRISMWHISWQWDCRQPGGTRGHTAFVLQMVRLLPPNPKYPVLFPVLQTFRSDPLVWQGPTSDERRGGFQRPRHPNSQCHLCHPEH